MTPLADPIFLTNETIAFIGFENGYSGIYIYDLKSKKLEKITQDKNYYRGLDFNAKRNLLVFSKEEDRLSKPCRYNYNLYSYNLATKAFSRLTESEYNELDPTFSPDGSKIAFIGDKDDVYNIFLYDVDNGKVVQATDVNVAALSPRWVSDEKLYVGTIKRFESFIYKMSVPTLKIAFSKNLPQPTDTFYSITGGDLVLAKDLKKDSLDKEIKFKSTFLIKGNNLNVIDGKRNYLVKEFVAHEGALVMMTEPGELNSWEIKKNEVVFSYLNGNLQRVTKSYNYPGMLDSTVENIIKAFKKDKSIVRMWVSPDATIIFILANNVLSFEKKKSEQSLYVIDVSRASIEEIPYYRPLAKIKDRIANVYFLAQSKCIFEVDRRDWEGDSYKDYYLLDLALKKFEEFDLGTGRFDISADSQYLLILSNKTHGGDALELYDSSANSRLVLYKAPSGYRIVDAHFIDNNSVFLGLAENAGESVGIMYIEKSGKTVFEKFLKVTEGYRFNYARSSNDGQYAALKIKDTRTKTGIEKLYMYHRGEDLLKEVGTDLSYFDRVFFAGQSAIFDGRDLDEFRNIYAYSSGIISKGYKIDSSGYSLATNTLVIGGSEDVLTVNLEKGTVKKIADKTLGFDVYEKNIVMSSFSKGYYNLYLYEIPKGSISRLTNSWFNELSPKISSGGIAYTVDEEKRFSIHLRPSITEDKVVRVYLDKADIYNPLWKDGKLYFNVKGLAKQEEDQKISEELKPDLWNNIPLDTTLKVGKVPNYLRPEYVFGGLAYDGSNALIFLSFAADNIFSDRGVFANIIYRSEFINSTIGYTNIEMGRTYTLYLNQLEQTTSGGFSFMKTYLLNKFMEFDLYTQIEYQRFLPDDFKGDTIEVPGELVKQYVIKSGAVYAYDATIWDYHGPVKGAKFLIKSELGLNLRTGKVSNIDANTDFRVYNQLVSRLGFAHRLMGGTSQGSYPTIYFLGGNISFRGVPFDGLEGNNYWVFSEDFRIPLFDILGAKLPDPVDGAIGPFFRFFDVRGGLYFDVGQVWFNKNDKLDQILYSFGTFINSPTIFGMTLRFSKGLVGQKGFNFWFGYNW